MEAPKYNCRTKLPLSTGMRSYDRWRVTMTTERGAGRPGQLWTQMVQSKISLEPETAECLVKAMADDFAEQKKIIDYLITGGQKPTLESLLIVMESATEHKDDAFFHACEGLLSAHRSYYTTQTRTKLKEDPEMREEVGLHFKSMSDKFGVEQR